MMNSKPESTISEAVGSRIGRFKLLQKIGEGGFGVVFMAEQQEPTQHWECSVCMHFRAHVFRMGRILIVLGFALRIRRLRRPRLGGYSRVFLEFVSAFASQFRIAAS